MTKLIASHMVIYSQVYACTAEIEQLKDHLSEHLWTSDKSLRNKPQQKQSGHAYMYIVWLDGKMCLTVVCLQVSFRQIQSHF